MVEVTEQMWVVATKVVVEKQKFCLLMCLFLLFLANAAYAAQYKDRMVGLHKYII